MRDLPWPSYDRMVLAGCVLEGDFPWEELQGSIPPRFHEVRTRWPLGTTLPVSRRGSID